MATDGLSILSILSLSIALICSLAVTADIVIGRHRQAMKVMNWVWPITPLYSGPLGLWAYLKLGKAPRHGHPQPFWRQVIVSTTHCASGCTLGDIAAEWALRLTGFTIAGSELWAAYAVDYGAALALGLVFQYCAIVPMKNLTPGRGVWESLKADFLSLTAFQLGMYAWMALGRFVIIGYPLRPNTPVFWFMMQIGMILGFATSYPVNWWLVRQGNKEAM
jgi:hypothetical protein